MKKLILVALIAIMLFSMLVIGDVASNVASAQGCSVVDTFTASGVTSGSSTWAGSYNTIPGRRYTVTVSGTGTRGDGWVFDPVYASVDGSWSSPFYSQFAFGNSQRNHPTYSSSHSYDILIFGNDQPFTISTVGYSTTGVTISFAVSVCEDTQPYTTPSCTLVSQMNITGSSISPTTGPVLNNGQTYDLYIAGEFINEGANLDDFLNRSADPAAYTSSGWSSQYFPSNPPYNNVGVISGTAANYTLITSTYQSSHFYHATVDGTGLAIQLSMGGGWYLYGGGFVAYICDPSITPTPSPTVAPTPTITPGGWAFPIKTEQRDASPQPAAGASPFSNLDYGNPSALFMYSATVQTYVHSMVAGTVTDVQRLAPAPGESICANGAIYFDPLNGSDYCNGGDEYSSGLPAALPRRYFAHTTAWMITITPTGFSDGSYLRYIVAGPTVLIGDTVSMGCILGYTLPMKIVESQLDLVTSPHETASGWTMVQWLAFDNTPINIKPFLTNQPSDITCQSSAGGPDVDGCHLVANPTFQNDASGWTKEIAPATNREPFVDVSGGVVPVGYLTQRLMLNPGSDYSISVLYRSDLGSSAPSFTVQLGTEDAYTITADRLGGTASFTQAGQHYTQNRVVHDSMSGIDFSQYDLRIGPGNNPALLTVDYICISDETQPAPVCLLVNNEFDQSDGWTLDGGAEFVPSNGLVMAPDGGSISQSLHLYPNGVTPQSYKIEVMASRPDALSPGDTTSVNWEWDTNSGTFGPYDTAGSTVQSAEFTVSTETTDYLVLTAAGSDSSQRAAIYSVCITTIEGGPPPGYQPPPPNSPYCARCTYVGTGDLNIDMQNLIYWIGCIVSQLWHCQAKTILYGIWTAMVNLLSAFAFFRLWLSLTFQAGVSWVNADAKIFANFLNGQFLNLSNRLVPLVGTPGSSTNLWDVLLALVNAIRDLLLAALELVSLFVTTLFSSMLNGITTIMSFFPQVIAALTTAMNSNAAKLSAGELQCTNPDSLLYYPCLGLFILDQTIFTGPIKYLLPISLGMLGFSVLIWAIGRARKAFAS